MNTFPYTRVEAALGRHCVKFDGGVHSSALLSDALIRPVLGGTWPSPFVSLVRESVGAPLAEWTQPTSRPWLRTPLATEVVNLMANGYTLKVQNIELGVSTVRGVLCELERRTRRYGSAVFFMTPRTDTALVPHHDDTDVIVEQVQGSKSWSIWMPDLPPPLTSGLDRSPQGTLNVLTLEPGDLLYVPRGWTHVARTEGKVPSMHISYCLRQHREWQQLATGCDA